MGVVKIHLSFLEDGCELDIISNDKGVKVKEYISKTLECFDFLLVILCFDWSYRAHYKNTLFLFWIFYRSIPIF